MRPLLAAGLLMVGPMACTGVSARPSLGAEAAPAAGGSASAFARLEETLAGFLRAQHAPGAAVAITVEGRLVYAGGFGWADREAGERVTPPSLFRIASVSKPITAVAVLQLVERGRLSLDDRVFELLGGGEPADPRLRDVTVYQCLTHRGGWDREAKPAFDPVNDLPAIAEALGTGLPVTPEDFLRFIRSRPLDFTPGERFAYAPVGYRILGSVIERVTGEPYESYVRREVLAPLGIRRMRIGGSTLAERVPGEVRYYSDDLPEEYRYAPPVTIPDGAPAPLPYSTVDMRLRAPNGGWIASAVDLVRFACAFDDPARCPILQPETVALMFAVPPGPPPRDAEGAPLPADYACGWSVHTREDGIPEAWHTGALFGTSALLVHAGDGMNVALLFNQETGTSGRWLTLDAWPLLREALDGIRDWPDRDLFAAYE